MSSYRKEPLTGQMHVYVSENHRFGTDAFLLANFSNWRKKDLVCDLGTGCGIIPMILQRKNPPKHTWGVDIQADAIDQFSQAIAECGVHDRVCRPQTTLAGCSLGTLRFSHLQSPL